MLSFLLHVLVLLVLNGFAAQVLLVLLTPLMRVLCRGTAYPGDCRKDIPFLSFRHGVVKGQRRRCAVSTH
jgi:hypothetical protein